MRRCATHGHADRDGCEHRPRAAPQPPGDTTGGTLDADARPELGLRALAAVVAGGTAGGLARYGVAQLVPSRGDWPWAVIVANTAGAFVLGALLTVLAQRPGAAWWLRPALGSGFCGAFTTMSAVALAADRAPAATGAAVVVVSAVTGLVAAAVGIAAGRRVVP